MSSWRAARLLTRAACSSQHRTRPSCHESIELKARGAACVEKIALSTPGRRLGPGRSEAPPFSGSWRALRPPPPPPPPSTPPGATHLLPSSASQAPRGPQTRSGDAVAGAYRGGLPGGAAVVLRLRPRRALWPPQRSVGLVLRRGGLCERQRAPRRRLWWSKCVCSLSIWLFIP